MTPNLQAGLFSAIVTAFLVRALDDLQPDYQQQAALILHQLLNGRDPNLVNISDPTIPHKPAGSAIAVNCLWYASLSISLGASLGAIICKGWIAEYSGDINPVVGLLRACQRHMRFMAFERLKVHVLVAFLPVFLHSSVLLFFMGATIYLWRMDEKVATVFVVMGGILGIAYVLLTILPFVTNPPFRHYSTFLLYRFSLAIGEATVRTADAFARCCYLTLRYVTGEIPFPFVQTSLSTGSLHSRDVQARTFFPKEYRPMRVWWNNAPHDPLDDIDTSQKVQEQAILWLSRIPLSQSDSKTVVSSVTLISSKPYSDSRPHNDSRKPVIVLANLVLETLSSQPSQEQTDTAINCIILLGNVKFQSTVDRNSDRDHNIGGIPVPPSVAWVAQQLTIDAFQTQFNPPQSEGIQAQLLTAAAWLSPVEQAEDVEWNGQKLKIQDRWEFIEKIKMMLEQHVRGNKPLDNKVLINLIHGMYACIPRGNYGSASSIVSFLLLFCQDYDSSWSEDEAVLRALITYALDLLLPPDKRKPLVERKIRFDDLASELIDALMADTTPIDVVAFAFWLAYRVPYAFRSRRTILADIVYIWLRTNDTIPEDIRERLNFHATEAFIGITQHHVVVNRGLPRLTDYTALKLVSAALRYDHSRPRAIYTMAMIVNFGTSTQADTVMKEIELGPILDELFSSRGDLERSTLEEDIVDLQIYSTLTLLKFPRVELDAERVKGLIVQTEEAIGDPVRDPGVAKSSEVDIDVDLDRVRWKAIYLSALLIGFLPGGESGASVERLWTRVRALLGSGELSFAGDYGRCLEPLGMDVSELGTPAVDRQGQIYTVFELWIGGFPLFSLQGAVNEPPPGQKRNCLSLLNPKRWFG